MYKRQTQDDIDIVDHQVEDHTYFGAAGIKLCQAVYFDEHGFQFHVFQGQDCLLYTSDAADERSSVDLGGRRIINKKNNKNNKKKEHTKT